MTNRELKEKWPELKGKIQKEYPDLSAEDLVYEIGKEEELLLRLQQKIHKNREQINNWLSVIG